MQEYCNVHPLNASSVTIVVARPSSLFLARHLRSIGEGVDWLGQVIHKASFCAHLFHQMSLVRCTVQSIACHDLFQDAHHLQLHLVVRMPHASICMHHHKHAGWKYCTAT